MPAEANNPHGALQPHYFVDQGRATEAELLTRTVRLAGQHVTVTTARGVFSHEHLDMGTSILLDAVLGLVPDAQASTVVDLGCGWGPIALSLALATRGESLPNARIWAVDVNDRALDLTRRNAAALGLDQIRPVRPEDFPADTPVDLIVSNPPIRVGKAALHELLATWIPRLRPGGAAYLVVAKQLGADSLLRWLSGRLAGTEPFVASDGSPIAGTAERIQTTKGFRVLRITRDA